MSDTRSLKEAQSRYSAANAARISRELAEEREKHKFIIVVLDDDPTGIQTVHGIPVYTDWKQETLNDAFRQDDDLFFILTNSRSFLSDRTLREHQIIAERLAEASRGSGREFLLISRGDSTLRGHYPLETDTLRETLEDVFGQTFHGEIICPFFPEGGRYTIDDIHYVAYGDTLIPAGDTEFAQDKTFGYKSSHLGKWVEEKTGGRYPSDHVMSISLEALRDCAWDEITQRLCVVNSFQKIIVNALDYSDVQSFCVPLLRSLGKGKRFLFRTAAAFPKVIGGVGDKALLTRKELIGDNAFGGLIIVGSHVNKTTRQLERLKELSNVEQIVFDQHLVLDTLRIEEEVKRVVDLCERNISNGKHTAVVTRRDRLDLNTGNKDNELQIAVAISDALTAVVSRLSIQPGFLIAKGGITSSDVGVKGLCVKKAMVLGQVRPGIPVWRTGAESKFPGMSYIIFPGNVGRDEDLRDIVSQMTGEE